MNILQFIKTTKQHRDMTSLNKSLSEYGLSPNDWQINKLNAFDYKIINKSAPDFYFHGKIKFENGRKKWGSIQLASL